MLEVSFMVTPVLVFLLGVVIGTFCGLALAFMIGARLAKSVKKVK